MEMEIHDATYERRIKLLKAENGVLREWMRWVLHLQSGVGKNGGPSSPDEWIECMEQGMEYLREENK